MTTPYRYAIAFILTLCALGTQAQTPDVSRLWTTVGSAGTIDEADMQKVVLDHAIAQLGRLIGGVGSASSASAAAPGIAQTQSAVIRYNVTAVDGMFPPPVAAPPTIGTQLRLRFLDTGGSARVLARLIEVDLASGAETVRFAFDSNAFPSASNYQVQVAGDCNRRFQLREQGLLCRGDADCQLHPCRKRGGNPDDPDREHALSRMSR